ncbi:amidohydrolase family protein [Rhizobium lusitanum]|uniref:Amidohydrolase family protein n=1 Tax=Rhizobium lusitanum TaxID=293958 RepID=A0A6L9UHR8_9HYPH|nr:amidohydrolase [Rhizobium lusitanum]NEI73922.1 amidohydrolase family protein [Rhizobium lusitanum]
MTITADTIIRNGAIRTMDADRPLAQSIAIIGNRIVRVGSEAECEVLRGPKTQVIDAKGATILPGFNEAHLHIFGGSVSLQQLPVADVKGIDELRARITAWRAQNPELDFIVGHSAPYNFITDERMPRREDLDAACPDIPLLIASADHHTGWANTLALTLAGIDKGADVGHGSEVVTGPDGLATGELREAPAMNRVYALSPSGGRDQLGAVTTAEDSGITQEQRASDIAALREGLAYCARNGITSIQNMDGNYYQLDMLRELQAKDALPIRVRVPYLLKPGTPAAEIRAAADWRQEFQNDFLTCDFVKIFADGVVESGTAVLVDGYTDAPDHNGTQLFSDKDLNEAIAFADSLGLQVAVHAIGDGAVRQVLNAYEVARTANGPRDSRHRIEHIELLQESDFPRFAELGVVASMQPSHPPGAMDFPVETYLPRIGREREDIAFRTRELLESGVPLVFSSDWPVSRLEPLASIQAAVNRKPWHDGGKDQSVTLNQALHAYTRAGAWVEFQEDRKGKLAPGYLADIVILDADLTSVPSDELSGVLPVMTICNGKVIYRDDEF